MDAAKNAVKSFTSKVGHKTDVDENVHSAVVNETVKPHRHEETTQAVDKEVHQHHYHSTVQPLQHEERLPEKHTHQAMPTEHREIHHEDPSQTKAQVEAEIAQFKSGSKTHETTHSQAAAPTVTGEHVHHHVHENVIPVVHKSTVQPEVVHTTQHLHETHHAPSQHHGISQLPMKSLSEFQSSGGILDGNAKGHSTESYDGCPRPYKEGLNTTMDKLGLHSHAGNSGVQGGHNARDSGVAMDGQPVHQGHSGVVDPRQSHGHGSSDVLDSNRTGGHSGAVDPRQSHGQGSSGVLDSNRTGGHSGALDANHGTGERVAHDAGVGSGRKF